MLLPSSKKKTESMLKKVNSPTKSNYANMNLSNNGTFIQTPPAKSKISSIWTSKPLISELNWTQIKEKITNLFIQEFGNCLPGLIVSSEEDFFTNLNIGVRRGMLKIYGKEEQRIVDHKNFKEILDTAESMVYQNHYKALFTFFKSIDIEPGMKFLSSANFKSHICSGSFIGGIGVNSNTRKSSISNMTSHPLNSNSSGMSSSNAAAIHKCGGNIIEVILPENINIKSINSNYIVCLDCKVIASPSVVDLKCINCKKEYQSAFFPDYSEDELTFATWDKYHCDVIINDRMKCIKCKEFFYYSRKRNKLVCKSCKFEANPSSIIWMCILCKKEFSCSAKAYNPKDFAMLKDAIREALVYKVKAKPDYLPCCKANLISLTFYHKKACSGILFAGEFNKTKIVVCEKCKTMNFHEKYIWTCPKCNGKFKNDKVNKKEENSKESSPKNSKFSAQVPMIEISTVDMTSESHNSNTLLQESVNFGNSITSSSISSSKKQSFRPKTLMEILEERKQLQKFKSSIHFHKKEEKDNIEITSKGNNGMHVINLQKVECLDKPAKLDSSNTLVKINASSTHRNSSFNQNYIQFHKEENNDFTLEDFDFGDQIGQGSYGKIFLVKNKGDKFAMKKITACHMNDVKKIKREIEIVKKNPHENILKIYGVNITNEDEANKGDSFVVHILMELGQVDWNKEIRSRREGKKFYTEKELVSILNQVTDCLCFLQKANIAHRDIKPQNILIFERGVYKIADFGDAKEINSEEEFEKPTPLRGTELFMSPILFTAHRNKAKQAVHNVWKSDVFSLGFCLIYAATLSYKSIYDMREENDKNKISRHLDLCLRGRYSQKFVHLVKKMVDLEEDSRFDFVQLSEYLDKLY